MKTWIPATAAVLLLAGCGTAAAGTGSGVSVTSSANTQVCRNYLQQRAWVKSLVQPTLADALQFETDVTVDAAQATGSLKSALGAMQQANQAGRSDYAPSRVVLADCS